jgi:hypothetical protein
VVVGTLVAELVLRVVVVVDVVGEVVAVDVVVAIVATSAMIAAENPMVSPVPVAVTTVSAPPATGG